MAVFPSESGFPAWRRNPGIVVALRFRDPAISFAFPRCYGKTFVPGLEQLPLLFAQIKNFVTVGHIQGSAGDFALGLIRRLEFVARVFRLATAKGRSLKWQFGVLSVAPRSVNRADSREEIVHIGLH